MSSMEELVTQVQELENATTDLLEATNVSKQTLDSAVTSAEQDATRAETAEQKATPAADRAEAALTATEKARNDTEAIAYEGEASLEPTPGSIPVGDSEGKIHHGWLPDQSVPYPDFWLPLNDSLKIEAGFGDYDQIDVSAVQDGSVMVDLPTMSAYFSRVSVGWGFDKSGKIVETGSDQPSFSKKGIALEGASTNILPYSNDATEWASNYSSLDEVEDDFFPEGVSWFYTRNENSGGHVTVKGGLTIEAEKIFTASVFIKPTELTDYFLVRVQVPYPSRVEMRYNAVTEEFNLYSADEHMTALSGRVEKHSTGWIRLSLIFKNNASNETSTGSVILGLVDSSTSFPTGETHTAFIGGVQLEELQQASSYISTFSTPVTRAANELTIPPYNNIPEQPTDLTISLTYDCVNEGTATVIRIGGDRSYVGIGLERYAAYDSIVFSGEARVTEGHVCITYDAKAGIVSRYIDGVFDSSAPPESPQGINGYDAIRIGSHKDSDYLYGHVRDVKIWHKALTPEQIAML